MLKGYKTYLASALLAGFGVLASTDWISFLNDPKAGMVAVGSAVLMAVLRSVTSGPPGGQAAGLPGLAPSGILLGGMGGILASVISALTPAHKEPPAPFAAAPAVQAPARMPAPVHRTVKPVRKIALPPVE